MSIWMDLTNSLVTWKGGIVGIIRTELEIAKNLHCNNCDIRYFIFNGQCFEEVSEAQLKWLWEAESISSGYMKAMRRDKNNHADKFEEVSYIPPSLERAYQYSPIRKQRFIAGCKHLSHCLPNVIRLPLKGCYKIVTIPKRFVSKIFPKQPTTLRIQNKPNPIFSYPFQDNDLVFSCGWMYSGKEYGFERVKDVLPSLQIVYLVYDTILIREDTKRFYNNELSNSFYTYLQWVSKNCIAFLSGGETALNDFISFQKENKLPILKGYPVYFGSTIISNQFEKSNVHIDEYLKSIGIHGDYIIAVGSLDKRKNYDTIYKAFTILADQGWESRPQLIIVGKGEECDELLNIVQQDPRTSQHIVFVSPSDEQLSWLYKRSLFSILASAYEGWSLTLPEALAYGKFVIASDVKPLREIGGDFIAYTDTYDPFGWAKKIRYYFTHRAELLRRENHIKKEYQPITWEECGAQIGKYLELIQMLSIETPPVLYFDTFLVVMQAAANLPIAGILRSELMLMKCLYKLYSNVRFFALLENCGFVNVPDRLVKPILDGNSLDDDFDQCRPMLRDFLTDALSSANIHNTRNEPNGFSTDLKASYWYFVSCLSRKHQRKAIELGKRYNDKRRKKGILSASLLNNNKEEIRNLPFQKGTVVFSSGTGYGTGMNERLLAAKKRIGFMYYSVIYDLTPVLIPQCHTTATKENYIPFLEFTSKISDCILYGGNTALIDGIKYQKQNGLPTPKSFPIYFGSDATHRPKSISRSNDRAILKSLGVTCPFILSVGTIEYRKNHETLYRAYLRMLNHYDDVPTLFIAGRPGWLTTSFRDIIAKDDRIKNKIIISAPSDIELDALYRNCEFTVLPSIYEGWSLTLPESYYYGKFCICCDTPSLRETAGDLADYISAYDEITWCKRIMHYHLNIDDLKIREELIRTNWHPTTWNECAHNVLEYLNKDLQTIAESNEGRSNL